MKILYVANDRRAVELAAFALCANAADTAIAWAANLSDARSWIDDHRDVALLLIEVESDDPNCEWFISQIRGLGITAPVIVVSLHDAAHRLPKLEAAANTVVVKDLSFLNDLPQLVKRTLQPPPAPHAARPPR